MKFLHTMVRITDVKKSLAFYQELLELNLSRTMELKSATLYFLQDETGCCEIELTHNHELPEGGYSHGGYFGHFAFATDNMDEFTKKLKKFGLDYIRVPFMITEKGPKIAFITDPDGYTIELIEKK